VPTSDDGNRDKKLKEYNETHSGTLIDLERNSAQVRVLWEKLFSLAHERLRLING
jgi:hypothetical protein